MLWDLPAPGPGSTAHLLFQHKGQERCSVGDLESVRGLLCDPE